MLSQLVCILFAILLKQYLNLIQFLEIEIRWYSFWYRQIKTETLLSTWTHIQTIKCKNIRLIWIFKLTVCWIWPYIQNLYASQPASHPANIHPTQFLSLFHSIMTWYFINLYATLWQFDLLINIKNYLLLHLI